MELSKPFFPLTSNFFGLTAEYKTSLWKEIFICTQHLENITYSDVMKMETNKRRFFIGLYMNKNEEAKEAKTSTQTGKGQRKTKISGASLKSKIKSGEIN